MPAAARAAEAANPAPVPAAACAPAAARAPEAAAGTSTSRPSGVDDIARVIDHLNARAGTCFPSTPGSESHRLTRHALSTQTPEMLCAVIDLKASQWLGTERARYLRPATLFAPTKLENYLSEVHQRRHQGARRSRAPRSTNAATPPEATAARQRSCSPEAAAAQRAPDGATHPEAYRQHRSEPVKRLPLEQVNGYLGEMYKALGKARRSPQPG